MTEAEWLTSTDPQAMLAFLRDSGRASDRKLRLFSAACCRRVWNLLSDKYSRKALKTAERHADGEVSQEKLKFAWGEARWAAQVEYREDRQTAEGTAMWAVSLVCEADVGRALAAVEVAARCEAWPITPSSFVDAQQGQESLLRCIMGNPFRPLPPLTPFLRDWQEGLIVRMANAIYEERALPEGTLAPTRLGILADALMDAGCTDTDLLAHLRSPGPHVRGCWATDLLTGRQ
jgi:hypothetical protein